MIAATITCDMSIIATLPVFILSNPVALNNLLADDYTYHINFERARRRDWQAWAASASLSRDAGRPYHVFEKRWGKYEEEPGVGLLSALDCVAMEYLMVENQQLYVKDYAAFSRWQNLRSRMTMLPVKCRMLHKNGLPMVNNLVHPLFPSLADYIYREGLSESHLHLFACELPEESWLRDMGNVTEYYFREEHNFKKNRRLYESVYADLTPMRLANRMKLARILRSYLYSIEHECDVEVAIENMRKAYLSLVHSYDSFAPMENDCWMERASRFSVESEMKLWERIFFWEENRYALLESLLFYTHLYLLIQNQYLHLKRQQEERVGFAAFNDVSRHETLVPPVFQYLEDSFSRILKNTAATKESIIEVRITPWSFCHKCHEILKAWKSCTRHRGGNVPNLILVVHFIKTAPQFRLKSGSVLLADEFACERAKLQYECGQVAAYANYISRTYKIPVGIDAAGDELSMPVEVLAPVFRLFERQTGVSYKTYHCGEDFYHLIGGMRAVYDAVLFLKLKNGNRISHATAIGIKPTVWRRGMPDILVQRKGDWLLDLIFAWKMLRASLLEKSVYLEDLLMPIAYDIFEYSGVVSLSMQALQSFYEARHLVPEKVKAMLDRGEMPEYSNDPEEQLIIDFNKTKGRCGLSLLSNWHYDAKSRKEQEKRVELPLDILDDDVLVMIQQRVQRFVNECNVVIETLPVSNVRISQYLDVQEHHLLRWLKVDKHYNEGDELMTVCLGSDDPGIFVSDLKNEYYHVFANLMQAGQTPAQCLELVNRINTAGRIYAFRLVAPVKGPASGIEMEQFERDG